MLIEACKVIWPGAWDQPYIANQLVTLGVALEIVQARTGLQIARRTARGILVTGTNEAVSLEIKGAFKTLTGQEGQRMRTAMQRLRDRVKRDMEEGEAKEALLRLGDL